MSKAYTLEYVKEFAKSRGYECLSKIYINCKTKLKFKCPKEHICYINFEAFKNGQGCSECYGNKKKTIEEIRRYLKKYNYKLISEEYINSYSKLKMKCPYNHVFEMTWDSFRFGYRCNICGGTLKKNYNEVKNFIESYNYKLISKSYDSANKHLELICDKGHYIKMTWSMFQQGQRCGICYKNSLTGETHPNWRGGISCEPYCEQWTDKDYKESIKARDGYKCLNPVCSKSNEKLHIHHIDYDKKHCHPSNLITLCLPCNVKANYDRKWHKSWYQAIMYRRHGYCLV